MNLTVVGSNPTPPGRENGIAKARWKRLTGRQWTGSGCIGEPVNTSGKGPEADGYRMSGTGIWAKKTNTCFEVLAFWAKP